MAVLCAVLGKRIDDKKRSVRLKHARLKKDWCGCIYVQPKKWIGKESGTMAREFIVPGQIISGAGALAMAEESLKGLGKKH